MLDDVADSKELIITQQHCQKLAQELGELLVQSKALLTTAESCTGGWVAKCCTDCKGSSRWFDSSIVSYSYSSKNKLLGVDTALLQQYGAVDLHVVEVMATQILERTQAHYSVAISGIAGPENDANNSTKPVGTVCFAWARKADGEYLCHTESKCFLGAREAVRIQSVYHALFELKKMLNMNL